MLAICLVSSRLCLANNESELTGFCPDICGQLPEKQRTAAGLAVSMVVLTSCNGDIEGAARAVASAAADGDLQAFGAGLSVGATALAGPDDSGKGQMAQIISETLTVADSKNKTIGVASALGNALASMSGTAAEALTNQTIEAINDLALDVSCSAATDAAATVYFSIKESNPGLSAHFLTSALKSGNTCWVRRFSKLKDSPVFNLPPPTSPCTRRMQAASAVGLSLVTSSACRLDKSAPVAAAAYALVTAAVKDGCSFASAVAASTQFGIPKEAVQDVYTAAITKAGTEKEQWQLSNAFVAAFAQLDSAKHSDKLLESLLSAVDYTITFNGCEAPKAFAKSLFARLVKLDPANEKNIRKAFKAMPAVNACGFV
uniref:Uncharacterized protein n=1 Tax=Tetradesmus obliquus TaxID=3088 RepID=A0A383VYG4_TETOB|eukprot:jgi/Sobl393_1/12395/SZX69873.1